MQTISQYGLAKLIDIIGKDFFNIHKDTAVFSSEDTENGLFCFLGIDLHASTRNITLSNGLDEWDVYATCYVKDNFDIVVDKYKLPKQ